MNDKVPVVFEGKEYPIDATIAADDDKLRQVLSPFIPAAAHAKMSARRWSTNSNYQTGRY